MPLNKSNKTISTPDFRAVVFDLDGTLLNTLDDIADSMNTVLKNRGWPDHPVERYKNFVGDGVYKLAERSLPPQIAGQEAIRECAQEFKAVYGHNWKVKTAPYPGIPDLLHRLGQLGLKLGILSNKPHEATLQVAAYFFPEQPFDTVLGQEDHRPPKPDPAGPLEMSRGLGVSLTRILYCGDSGVDMQTALRSGMHPAGVLWGYRSAGELLAFGAKTLVRRPLELMGLLGQKPG
ncbi:MAG: HAD family hydrolase [Desulfohalobiaceae bacterium]|nr:HAD family hydrolase [Desulfohalobiaceae bacterium]